ncbi:hypothetical protein [Streptomyces poonensis]|uniref:Secreted protein n=1 Tax=Streptomyces poonensis TaxID=68255 RepID=A0A918UDD0_9ACTN|nr:hypothetical protein [Streptomyces poonensis]GGY96045.1 hypothetical protein GCM10010365_13690 [Streptomyces poonensis]GLJ88900.1 hypothetical protein GCM10017589_15000 [Streptomyces poonensis]
MTDNDTSVPAPAPGSGLGGMPPTPAQAAPEKAARRRRVAVIAGSLLLAGAVVAGTGYTAVTVRDADRSAGAPRWEFPKTTKADDPHRGETGGLAGDLVPYDGDTWRRGPDLGEFGSDTELSGAEATALRKESLRDLPRTQRKLLERQIDRQRVEGMAMRSYLSTADGYFTAPEKVFTASVVLARMDKAAARNIAAFQSEFFDALGVLREGPKVKEYEDARCFLPPKDSEAELDSVFCSAYRGDVLVTVSAAGAKPLDAEEVAALLRTQLDRIGETGEAA